MKQWSSEQMCVAGQVKRVADVGETRRLVLLPA